jgi:hypothetical protein
MSDEKEDPYVPDLVTVVPDWVMRETSVTPIIAGTSVPPSPTSKPEIVAVTGFVISFTKKTVRLTKVPAEGA